MIQHLYYEDSALIIIMESLLILKWSQRFPRSASCSVVQFLFSPRPLWSLSLDLVIISLILLHLFSLYFVDIAISLFLPCSFPPPCPLLAFVVTLLCERQGAVDKGLLEDSGKFFIYFLHHMDRYLKMKLFLARLSSGAAEGRQS